MRNLSVKTVFYRLLQKKSTVPRWIIFTLDLFICAFALFFAYLLRFNMDFYEVQKHGYWGPVLFVVVLNIIFFRVFHTYEGIIRLSSAQEGIRCVVAVFYSSYCLLISRTVGEIFDLPYLVPASVIIIYFFTASFLIFAYRIWAKELYRKSGVDKAGTENVLVFGDTMDGALLKRAIESISDMSYKVVGFIEDNKNLVGKSIDNAKIYSLGQVNSLIHNRKIRHLFLTSNDTDLDKKNEVVDFFLNKNITVKVIPALKDLVNGNLQTRQLKTLKIEDLLNRPSIQLASKHLQEYLSGKRILITGAAGSIGSEIVKQLVAMNAEQLILCDNRETALYELEYQLHQLGAKNHQIIVCIYDIRNADLMRKLFESEKPQIVFHVAAYKHVPLMEMHPCEAVKNNVMGTKIVADLCIHYGVERCVFVSTDKAVNPTNVMGASKRIAEMYVQALQINQKHIEGKTNDNVYFNQSFEAYSAKSQTRFIITRFGNVLGSNGSVIPRFQDQIDNGGPVTVTHPEVTRYFMTISEACSLVLEAGTMGKGGEIFVFDMGEPVKIADLARKMIKLEGLTPGKDILIEYTGLRPGEKLYEELLCKNEEIMPTHHKRIMISKVDQDGLGSVMKSVDDLIKLAAENVNTLVVAQMKMIVPEYKSENSAYAQLDQIDKSGLIQVAIASEPHFKNWDFNKS